MLHSCTQVLLVELEMEGRATATLLGIERGDWSQELAMLRALDRAVMHEC